MERRPSNRAAWRLATITAAVVLVGIAMLLVRLRPYWVAKYQGASAELEGAFLQFAPLSGANLTEVRLSRAVLREADLSGARLERAHLDHADLRGADLHGAYLAAADLCDADLRRADLHGAYLGNLPIPGAHNLSLLTHLAGADLREADLRGADLTDASLTDTRLKGAVYNARTRWPPWADAQELRELGVVLVR